LPPWITVKCRRRSGAVLVIGKLIKLLKAQQAVLSDEDGEEDEAAN
jgi:hypothetical protein